MVNKSKVIAAAHIEKLMKVGYVRDGTSRPLSNDLGPCFGLSMRGTRRQLQSSPSAVSLRFIPDVLQTGFCMGRLALGHQHRPVVFSRPSEVKM